MYETLFYAQKKPFYLMFFTQPEFVVFWCVRQFSVVLKDRRWHFTAQTYECLGHVRTSWSGDVVLGCHLRLRPLCL